MKFSMCSFSLRHVCCFFYFLGGFLFLIQNPLYIMAQSQNETSSSSQTQTKTPNNPQTETNITQVQIKKPSNLLSIPGIPIAFVPVQPDQEFSILFTHWEKEAIQNALRIRALHLKKMQLSKKSTDSTESTGEENLEPLEPLEPGIREIDLSGIVYISQNNWRVWLNDTEIQPGQLPKQAIFMNVSRNYIDIQWFDPYTNQIFPIRLRVGQRFNLDMRTFLPRS